MLSERVTVYVNLNEIMELDPIRGKGDTSSVFRAENASELKNVLVEIRALSQDAYARAAGLQRKFAEGIYAPLAIEDALILNSSSEPKSQPELHRSP